MLFCVRKHTVFTKFGLNAESLLSLSVCSSASVFKIKIKKFFGYFDPEWIFFKIIKKMMCGMI